MDALDLLTEDCWKEILKRVKAPKDLWSCSEACFIFQEILRRKRNEFMFHLVLPHILKYLPRSELYPENVLKRHKWKALLKPRLVCKSWRTAIDKLRDAKYPGVFYYAYHFTSGEGIETFLRKFADHAGNPFLGRLVTFEFNQTPQLLAGDQGLNADRAPAEGNKAFFIRKRHQLLERFGNHIWTVTMRDYGNTLAFSKNIQMDLIHLPNLRTLQLAGPFFEGDYELDQGNTAELTTYIAANPLPVLPRLRTLSVNGMNRGIMQFILEKYAPQLRSFQACDTSGLLPFPEHSSRLSNLVKLALLDLDASTSLQGLRELQSPLRKLDLEVASNRNSLSVWPTDELFRNFVHLPIRHLTIWVHNNVFLGESGPITAEQRPQHGTISSVDLSYQNGGASFNFLLYCPELTSVELVRSSPRQGIPAGHPNGVPELLDVCELLGQVGYDFYESNIWDNLQKLQDFDLGDFSSDNADDWRWHYYDRGGYEQRKLEKGEVAAGEEL